MNQLKPDVAVVPAVAPGIASLRKALDWDPVAESPARGQRLFGPTGAVEDKAVADLWGHVYRARLDPVARWALVPSYTQIYLIAVVPRTTGAPPVIAMTRAAMGRLDASNGGIGPWVAAIHRSANSAHAHVVLAATREHEGRHVPLFIDRADVADMQDAAHAEWLRHQELVRSRSGRSWHR